MTEPAGSKNISFTYFDIDNKKALIDYHHTYLIIGNETCPTTGKKHFQGYMEFKSVKEFIVLQTHFKGMFHEKRKGTQEQAINYCKKGEQSHKEWKKQQHLGPNFGKNADFEEFGEPKKTEQGKRKDLIALCDSIKDGEKADDIFYKNPMALHQYGRTLSKIEDLRMRKIFRKEPTLGYWLWGETGLGKSEIFLKDFHPDTHYVWEYNPAGSNDWQDAYTQQKNILIDDFRGQIPYNVLLRMIDKWPNFSCKRRAREPLPFTSKIVIITSPLPPQDLFVNLHLKDSLKQLERRCKIIRVVSGERVILEPFTY